MSSDDAAWQGKWQQMVQFNRTERAAGFADLMYAANFESHRGALRWRTLDTEKTDCVALFGNDGYSPRPGVVVQTGSDSDVDNRARTRAYVHGLYAGWSNLLPEGAVEFGVDKDGYSWAILLHLPKGTRSLPDLLRNLVWDLWDANLPGTACTAQKSGGAA